ncbi:aldo/keto reductase [Paenibacillus hamazuiensis]|uniref:aldo/keto reductase n=1 Tax=Paenibacillus hamazuiensis TaxID=2936508 RepID=UPI00200E811A|nr:aldo/keto reductase [Paenibacillus hamazuiensis]
MKRKLGRSGIEVSALGVGCWAIGGPWHDAVSGQPYGWGKVDDNESVRALQCAIDNGITLIDTADNYGAGHSETVVGKAISGKRSKLVVATKFGYVTRAETKEAFGSNASKAYIKQACEASLRRLNTDYIDLYQLHLNDYPADLAEDVIQTLEELVAEGKIRRYGWSTDFPNRAELFAQAEHCAAIQHELNVFHDSPAILEICEAYGLASLNRCPLAMGLLTGKYTAATPITDPCDIRGRQNPDWLTYFHEGYPSQMLTAKLNDLRDVLTSGGRTLAQGALAWLWARSRAAIPIPGFRTVKQVMENVKAMEYGPLTAEQMLQITRILYEEQQV